MEFQTFGNEKAPTLLLIPGLGVSYEIFLPLLGGKILLRVLERDEITVDHAVLDAAPLLPLPRWLVGPLCHYQAFNVWTCYR